MTVNDRPLLFSILLLIGDMSEKDESPVVRKRCIEVVGHFTASATSFFTSAVGNCFLHDPDKQNQYFCADLSVNHPTLVSTNLYIFNRDRINSIISESTGKSYPSQEMIAEAQAKAIQRDRDAANEILQRAKAQGVTISESNNNSDAQSRAFYVNIFGARYIITKNRIRPEIVLPLWGALMMLCGVYCYRIARRRNANSKLWMIIGAVACAFVSSFCLYNTA